MKHKNLKIILTLIITMPLMSTRASYAAVTQGKLGATSKGTTNVTLTIPERIQVSENTQTKGNTISHNYCLQSNDSAGFILSNVDPENTAHIAYNGTTHTLSHETAKMEMSLEHKTCDNETLSIQTSALSNGPTHLMLEPQ